jgi:8-oxo-dGTP diphosphatase
MPKPDDVGVGTAIFILNNQRQVLLYLRKGAHASGLWAVPGGWMDRADTSSEVAIARETLEETGIQVVRAYPLCWTTEDHKDLGVRTVTLYHYTLAGGWNYVTSLRPQLMEPNKAEKWAWFDLDELPDNLFPKLPEAVAKLKATLGMA